VTQPFLVFFFFFFFVFFRLFSSGPNQMSRKGEAKRTPKNSKGENKLISVQGEVEGARRRGEEGTKGLLWKKERRRWHEIPVCYNTIQILPVEYSGSVV